MTSRTNAGDCGLCAESYSEMFFLGDFFFFATYPDHHQLSLLFFIFSVNSDLKCFNNITACMCLEMNQKTSVISFKGLTVCNFFSCFCVTVCYNVI